MSNSFKIFLGIVSIFVVCVLIFIVMPFRLEKAYKKVKSKTISLNAGLPESFGDYSVYYEDIRNSPYSVSDSNLENAIVAVDADLLDACINKTIFDDCYDQNFYSDPYSYSEISFSKDKNRDAMHDEGIAYTKQKIGTDNTPSIKKESLEGEDVLYSNISIIADQVSYDIVTFSQGDKVYTVIGDYGFAKSLISKM